MHHHRSVHECAVVRRCEMLLEVTCLFRMWEGVEDCRAEEEAQVFAQVAGKLWVRIGEKGPWERRFFVSISWKETEVEIFFPIEKLTSATNTSGSWWFKERRTTGHTGRWRQTLWYFFLGHHGPLSALELLWAMWQLWVTRVQWVPEMWLWIVSSTC